MLLKRRSLWVVNEIRTFHILLSFIICYFKNVCFSLLACCSGKAGPKSVLSSSVSFRSGSNVEFGPNVQPVEVRWRHFSDSIFGFRMNPWINYIKVLLLKYILICKNQ
jgi:hypothetical protein